MGMWVFGRHADYDTNQEALVRVSAAEIRKRIAQYYHGPGKWTELRIELPPGSAITERFARVNFGRLEIEVTVDDPKVYTKPWTITVNQIYAADTDLLEYICLENEKDIKHMAAGAEKSGGVSK